MQQGGYEVYEAYLQGHEEDIKEGRPFVLEVRDREEMVRKVVKARVSKDPSALPNGQPLWVRSYERDELRPEPWAIEVVEELDDDTLVERPDEGRMIEPPKIY